MPGRILPHLAHFCDGVVEDAPGIISAFTHQLHLPGPRGQPQVGGVQLDHLPGNLNQDGLALPAPWEEKEERSATQSLRCYTHPSLGPSADLVEILLTVIWGP